MSQAAEFTIGSGVSRSDGACRELRRVVVDPVALALTHLVVEPKHRPGADRLVPVGLAGSSGAGIRLRRTTAQFEALEAAEETQFLPGGAGQWGYGQDQMLSWPYYGLGAGAMGGMGMDGSQGTCAPGCRRVLEGGRGAIASALGPLGS